MRAVDLQFEESFNAKIFTRLTVFEPATYSKFSVI